MNINIISRGKSKSAVAAAAYRAGEQIKNDYDGEVHDYTAKKGVTYTEIILPNNAPIEFRNRATLWNAVEKIEKNSNAQLAREIRVALPKEFDREQNINLVHEYVRHNFVRRGMVADICYHDKQDGNPHCHIMLTMRPFEKDGTWGAKSRMEYILDDNGERQKLPSGRYKTKKITTTDWDNRENAEMWREEWANITNHYLKHYGHEMQIDHRSYERQGIEQLPTIHLGMTAHQLEQKGISTERGDINREIEKANAQLRIVNKEIRTAKKERYDLLNPPPPRPQFIIDIENCIKAKDSPAYEHWARIFNLKQMSQTLIYIEKHGYQDLQSLQTAHQNAVNEITDIQNQLDEITEQRADLDEKKKFTEMYRNNKEVYNQYKGFFLSSSKRKFYDQHKTEIDSYTMARAYIFDEQGLEKIPNLKNISNEKKKLAEREKGLKTDQTTAKETVKVLKATNHNVQILLGYNELELQDRHPTATIQNRLDIPVYKETFATAKNTGNMELYFQNKHLNHECAEVIKSTIKNNLEATPDKQHNYSTLANACTRVFGMERTEWVISTALLNVKDLTLASAIGEFKTAVKGKIAQEYWDKQTEKLSFKDSIAVAQQRADEHNQSREAQAPRKKNKDMAIGG